MNTQTAPPKQTPERLSPQELEFAVFQKYRKLGIAKTEFEIHAEVVELMQLQK